MGTHDTKSSEKFEQNGRVSLILFIIKEPRIKGIIL